MEKGFLSYEVLFEVSNKLEMGVHQLRRHMFCKVKCKFFICCDFDAPELLKEPVGCLSDHPGELPEW